MQALYGIAGFLIIYLALLARSAWIQGELRQFGRAVVIVAALVAMILAIAFGSDRFGG